jgi:hypothetical protein
VLEPLIQEALANRKALTHSPTPEGVATSTL